MRARFSLAGCLLSTWEAGQTISGVGVTRAHPGRSECAGRFDVSERRGGSMRQLLLLSLVIAVAACGPGRSDVEVDWTFEGLSCSDARVATIQVDVAGEVLSPNQFTCAEASLGADLGTYIAGTYQVTITGFDAFGAVTHQIIQSIVVHG